IYVNGFEKIPVIGIAFAFLRQSVYNTIANIPIIGLPFKALSYVASIGSGTAASSGGTAAATGTGAPPSARPQMTPEQIQAAITERKKLNPLIPNANPDQLLAIAQRIVGKDQVVGFLGHEPKPGEPLTEEQLKAFREVLPKAIDGQVAQLTKLAQQATAANAPKPPPPPASATAPN